MYYMHINTAEVLYVYRMLYMPRVYNMSKMCNVFYMCFNNEII